VDDADRADAIVEAELAALIDAARGIKPRPRLRCRECEEELPEHRRLFGTCYLCQAALEARIRRDGYGA
jgi:hypothetical protein